MRHSKEELQEMVNKMQAASNRFYADAVFTGCHQFIEFTGLMNEFIKLCREALDRGQDFTETSIHGSGAGLPAAPYHAEYVAEKLGCIYGTTFREPELKQAFLDEMFGESA